MILTDAVLNAYINANIILVFAYALWTLTRCLAKRLGFQLAHIVQLRLLNGVFLAIVLSPVAILFITSLVQFGLISPNFSLSVADFAVAQYLNGSIEMKATEFEKVLGFRNTLIHDFLSLKAGTGFLVIGLFLVGFAAVIYRSLVNILKLRNILKTSYLWRQFGSVKILLSDTTFVPFSTRSFKTRFVVIPSGMLAENDDMKMALSHEFQHMRQGDIEWEFILEILRPFFFWNPVFFFWKHQVQKLRELACDQQLVSKKKLSVQAYCECLLKVCRNSIRKDDEFSIALPAVPFVQVDRSPFGLNSARLLKQRVVAIIEPSTVSISRKAYACILLPSMALVILASLAIQSSSDWSQDRLMLSTIVNLERMETRSSLAQ